jgi:hypothetical protein
MHLKLMGSPAGEHRRDSLEENLAIQPNGASVDVEKIK